jgi:hypothetical protein
LTDTFNLSEDPLFIAKVRDIIALYLDPPTHAVVLCADKRTGIQALDQTQPILPMRPGHVERRKPRLRRNGVTDLFATVNVATGQLLTTTPASPRARVQAVPVDNPQGRPRRTPNARRVDNSSTYMTPEIHRWLLRNPRFDHHPTPTRSSSLNLGECWFPELTRGLLKRSAYKTVAALQRALRVWTETCNVDPKPFVWHKTATRSSTPSPDIRNDFLAPLPSRLERVTPSALRTP